MNHAPHPPRALDPLQELRERFRASGGGIVAGFRALGARLASDPASPAVLSELRGELHRVRGTAGTFGFMHASELAEGLEERVLGWMTDPAREAAHRVNVVAGFARELEDALS